jgi:hypothetical protein
MERLAIATDAAGVAAVALAPMPRLSVAAVEDDM